MVRPIAVRTGRARSTSAASPPTKIVSVAFLAPSLPPETGASTIARSRSARRSAKSQLPDGAMVEQSTMSVPGRAPSATPSGPNRTASTSGVSETQMTTMPASATAAAGVSARVDAELGELRGPARRPVPAGDVKAGPGQVGRHRRTHRAETEEGDRAASGDGRRSCRPAGVRGRTRVAPGSAAAQPPDRVRGVWASSARGIGRAGGTFRVGRPGGWSAAGGRRVGRSAAAGDEEGRDRSADGDQDDERQETAVTAPAGLGTGTGLGPGVGTGVALGAGGDLGHDDLDTRLRVAMGQDRDACDVPPGRVPRRRPRRSRRSQRSAGSR